ncbi:MAG TPA: hypothetical protein VJ779_07030 [Acetobacteraceae bacterium]|nr:hypothetical protein [Acetobacteraceae bacterium]
MELAVKEIQEADDRAAAIVAAAFVEDYLTGAIKANVQRDDRLLKDLFKPDGIAGAFGAKISLGFLIGLYDATLRKELEWTAKISNRFAHEPQANRFDSDPVRDLVANLTAGERISVTLTGLGAESTLTQVITQPVKPSMSLRERFVSTCYMFLRIFAVEQVGAKTLTPIIDLPAQRMDVSKDQETRQRNGQKPGTSRKRS